ncbi:CAP domain-containing protein [Paenalkalicoccus suaedae]|uniref:CAP domain-containing protein n=1 Tax=Paenalkalicoccus suaedae TaxID=2592382 RepID=A0A859FEN0_9BACI|nr:CAP domain-containing protein [Paenalkalicoccus suaedae]QKS71547.1 CAP domain-containing protein [Paenalkalicoccus suaedae]
MKFFVFAAAFVAILAVAFFYQEEEQVAPESQVEYEAETEPIMQEDGWSKNLSSLMTMTETELIEVFDEPTRIDGTPYGYEWYVYENEVPSFQVGISNGEVVTAYSNEEQITIEDYIVGDASTFTSPNEITLASGLNRYTFQLTDEELQTKPLIEVGEGLFAQVYLDRHDQTISSIRLMEEDVLLAHRPYTVSYRGELPEQPTSEDFVANDWRDGQEEQILHLTNVIRDRRSLQNVEWHEEASEVAYSHSREMDELGYFAHDSPVSGSLSDRFQAQDILYMLIGENIASNYVDGIDAVEGWLNSPGHREQLFNEEWTHLGVGVHDRFYTQNFIVPY